MIQVYGAVDFQSEDSGVKHVPNITCIQKRASYARQTYVHGGEIFVRAIPYGILIEHSNIHFISTDQ